MEVDGENSGSAQPVWEAISSHLERLKDEVVCVTPDSKLKAEIKKKFKSHEAFVKEAVETQIAELLKGHKPRKFPKVG